MVGDVSGGMGWRRGWGFWGTWVFVLSGGRPPGCRRSCLVSWARDEGLRSERPCETIPAPTAVPSYDGVPTAGCYGVRMTRLHRSWLLSLPLLTACAAPMHSSHPSGQAFMRDLDFIEGDVRVTEHRGGDDLLSAGLGLGGLAGVPAAYVDPLHPTAGELRRRAIQNSWKGIADLGPLGGYGRVYG